MRNLAILFAVVGFVTLGILPSTATAQADTNTQTSDAGGPGSRPTCRYCPNPDYPLEARKAKIESASVMLEITVTEKGDADPSDIRVIEDPGSGFADEAITAVKKWKFKPATLKNGKPVKARVKVEVTFRDTH